MENDDIDAKLEQILKDIFLINKIDLNKSMDEIPEWDSLRHIQLISTIEQEFNIQIDFEDSIEMTSIPELKRKISKYLNDK